MKTMSPQAIGNIIGKTPMAIKYVVAMVKRLAKKEIPLISLS